MRKVAIVASLLAAAALMVVAAAALAGRGGNGHGGNNFGASLNGYNEVVGGPGASTGSVSTTGHGRITLRIFNDHIHYVLDYADMQGGTVSFAHIHFAERHF